MIDFRYHIVSIIAVFLALGLGILMGTTFLDRAVVGALEGQVTGIRERADRVREEAGQLQQQVEEANAVIQGLTPWVLQGRLAEQQAVFVTDAGAVRWRDAVRGAIVRAGARNAGTLTLTDRWSLAEDGDTDELLAVISSVTPAFDPGEDPAREALTLLGERLLEPTGHDLVQRLVDARFLALETGEPTEPWPPAGSVVVGLASTRSESAPHPAWLASFTRGTASIAPTVVVSAAPDDVSAVSILRAEDDLPPDLATFDSGEDDPSGIGSVLALRAAIDMRGGHFGAASGVPFFPEPPAPSPAPASPPPPGES